MQIRQYQEMVSELMGVYKEHNFVHVAKLPVRVCGRWAEVVEGKSKRSTRESFAKRLEEKSENMRVKAEVDAGEARMEKV